jgi:transcriptional regulator with XRE-family HTH domain
MGTRLGWRAQGRRRVSMGTRPRARRAGRRRVNMGTRWVNMGTRPRQAAPTQPPRHLLPDKPAVRPAWHAADMAARQRLGDTAALEARALVDAAMREVRHERIQLGLSLKDAGRRGGMSSSQFSRLEVERSHRPTLEQVCRAARAVGLRARLKLYPADEQVRDTPQLGVLNRFEQVLESPLRMVREVGLPIAGDRRAWDGRISDGERTASIEAIARLDDVQETHRRIELKRRDDPAAGVVLLVIGRTAHNRRVLVAHREALRAAFPLDGAAIMRDLRRGRVPASSGILLC